MTSPHDTIASEGRNSCGIQTRLQAGDERQRHSHGDMINDMAAVIRQPINGEHCSDVFQTPMSDYGSDIDLDDIQEDTVLGRLAVERSTSVSEQITYPGIEHDAQNDHGALGFKRPPVVHLEGGTTQESFMVPKSASLGIEYDAPSHVAFGISRHEPPYSHPSSEPKTSADDTRAPIVRFRTKPKKPLSVTDLVSPAWCELQYSYTLSKFGRKPRTQAMKQGSKIHQALEDEVFTEVVVETVTKEDRFGLRIWNTIQRLRTLRETGLTRELEIWGIVEGQVINGVIDELSFSCPDAAFEEKIEAPVAQGGGRTLPLGQLSIEQVFGRVASGTRTLKDDPMNAWLDVVKDDRRVYICDIKTRSGRSLPSKSASRQTSMQLMLYRKLLESLSLNTVDAESVFSRYDLAPLEIFSEAFLSGDGGGGLTTGEVESDAKDLSISLEANELRTHPNLLSIWSLMISEMKQTIPFISHLLRAEYRYAKTGEVIGNELIVYSSDTIDTYIRQGMEWWNGNREARGVEIEEAFKCQKCDFAETCTWRRNKVEEATQKHRLRKMAREKSEV